VVVPEVSTFEQQGISYVYKVQGDSLAILTSITVKERINNLVIVSSGLNAGERIVYEGTGKLRDKTPIKPQLVPFDSIAQTLKVAFK
jgi:membrane fusion protein (multidrug efflux system)